MVYLFSVLRAFVVVMYLLVVTIILSLVTILLGWGFQQPDLAFRLVRDLWAKPILFLAGVEVEYREEPGFPASGFLYLFNHTSYNDIFAMLVSLRKPPKFGAKAELFKIPFFGVGMAAVGLLMIHRDKREKVLKMYRDAKIRVEQGEHFALAPEGTRQKTDELGKFKKGPFYFAIHSQMPVVPLVIAGARQTQPKGHYLMNLGAWKRKIIVKALKPVDGAVYNEESLETFQQVVRERMESSYAELKSELGI